ncbi:TPA: tetratricopeptide repeat protein, partial [Candidatus Poribacteria bacterium]|nr:tetratricopeptide repeat protein [Candidatus Poribacteria bacterium]
MMPRNNGLRLQAFATTGPLGRKIILVIQFFSLCVLWFTGCSTNIKDVASNLELINGKPSEYQQAITEFERVIEINPESEWSHYNLGLVHYNQGKYQQA